MTGFNVWILVLKVVRFSPRKRTHVKAATILYCNTHYALWLEFFCFEVIRILKFHLLTQV